MTSTTVHSRNRASFPTRRSSDLLREVIATLPRAVQEEQERVGAVRIVAVREMQQIFACEAALDRARSEEHTSELQSREKLVSRLLLSKKKIILSSRQLDTILLIR